MESSGKCKDVECQWSQKDTRDFFAFPHPSGPLDVPNGQGSNLRTSSMGIQIPTGSKIDNATTSNQIIPPIKLASLNGSCNSELKPLNAKQDNGRSNEQNSSNSLYNSSSNELVNESRPQPASKSDNLTPDNVKDVSKEDIAHQCSTSVLRFDNLHRAPLRISQSSLVSSPRHFASYNTHPYPEMSTFSPVSASLSSQPRSIMPLSHLNSKKGVSKSRYTAEENLFILTARKDPFKIPWRIMPEIAARWYSAGRGRNGRNMQVHYSQNVKPRLSSLDDMNDDMQQYLTNSVNARLPVFYHGVLEELKKVEPTEVQLPTSLVAHSTRTWIDYSKQKLSCSLEEAVEMKALKMKRASCGGDKIDFTNKKNQ